MSSNRSPRKKHLPRRKRFESNFRALPTEDQEEVLGFLDWFRVFRLRATDDPPTDETDGATGNLPSEDADSGPDAPKLPRKRK